MEDMKAVSDGYHTFEELYEHRHALFLALMRSHPKLSWRAMHHDDGTMYDDHFIAGINLPHGTITYHLPIKLWPALSGLVGMSTLNRAPEWDGHTANDVITRLLQWRPNKQIDLPEKR